MCLLSVYMNMHHMCALYSQQSEDGLTTPELVVVGSCEPHVSTANRAHLSVRLTRSLKC